ncbi:hypothetical protein [Halopseudomonas xiamenensis]|uniref:hypothetical protein n=1 Tax=Halopseudomonas xiamenensis TaxID=157792 RepID=UPI001627CB20|nr:hypothetical protein [Halopseudomonas xiamenensis]
MQRPEGLWPFTEMVLDQIELIGSRVLKIEARDALEPEEPDFLWGLLTPRLELSEGEYMTIDHEAGEFSAAIGMRGCSGGDPTFADQNFLQPTIENAALVAQLYCNYFTHRTQS